MMMGLGVTEGETPEVGVCEALPGVPLSDVMGGFFEGLQSWAWDYDRAVGDPDVAAYSFKGFVSGVGTNFSQIFDPTLWGCNPTYQVGRIIPPVVVLALLAAIVKRKARY